MKSRWMLVWLVAATCWSAYAGFFATELMAMRDDIGQPILFGEAMRRAVVSYWIWIPISVALYAIVWRFPVERGRIARSLIILSAAVTGVILVRAVYVYVCNDWLPWYAELPEFSEVVRHSLYNNLLLSCLIVGVLHAFFWADRTKRRERQMADLESQLARARLDALSAQLNPHFLFNTLNSIAELVHHDADAADRMLVSLSTLLRRSLGRSTEHEVSLHKELELVSHYLSIEKMRLGSRLHTQRIIEPDCMTAAVPVLMLQTLVENSIIHSIARRETPGTVSISARHRESRLVIEVENDSAQTESDRRGHGVGLSNTQERLRCLYGDEASLTFVTGSEQSVKVRLELPFRNVPDRRSEPDRSDKVITLRSKRPV